MAGADFFGDLGGAVSDIFGAIGDQKAASGYGVAAGFADQEAALTARSTAITQQQLARSTYQIMGGQQADIAGAGFTQSGSALDLMRASRQQSALSNQLLSNQGQITQAGFEAEAQGYRGQADAAKTKSGGGFLNGVLGIAGAALSIFSDERLKRDITFLREEQGFKIYSFSYIWDEPGTPKREGIMAQDIAMSYPNAIRFSEGGFMRVDVDQLMKEAA